MKIKKIVIYALISLNLFVFFTPAKVNAQSTYYNNFQILPPTSAKVDDIHWQYSVINGVLCKRLYNYSTNTPLSDWEPVT